MDRCINMNGLNDHLRCFNASVYRLAGICGPMFREIEDLRKRQVLGQPGIALVHRTCDGLSWHTLSSDNSKSCFLSLLPVIK